MRGSLPEVVVGSRVSQSPKPRTRSGWRRFGWLAVGLGVCTAAFGAGCSRGQYRKDADQQAYELIHEKESDPRWQLPEMSVYADRRSRFYEQNDPDCPPIPPDDPSSHELMHCVYGLKGYKRWHKNGDLSQLENSEWREHLVEVMPQREDGSYVLGLDSAVQLALLNSPRYQRNVENLYLSALDVSFERFRFDTQFFAGVGRGPTPTQFVHRASEFANRTGGSFPTDSSSTLTLQNNAQARKLLPAGGQFVADFANTFVWQFVGSDRNTRADSLLSFTFLQPLLRRGGREVVMELLTRSERSLLANVRQMDYYRQGFLIDVAYGAGSVQGPSRQGGFAGGSGLSGFTGQGGGGFSGVGESSNFGRVGGGGGGAAGGGGGGSTGFAAGIAGNVSGFVGLVQLAQQIRNSEANLEQQLENLERTEALFAAGRIDSLQVDQFRQNVQTTQSQLLSSRNQFQNTLENYLISTLGLPPDLPVRIDESIVEPFQFSEPRLRALQNDLKRLITQTRTMEAPSVEAIRKIHDDFLQLRGPIAERFGVVRNDFGHLDDVKAARLASLADETARKAFLDQVGKLAESFAQLVKRFAATESGAGEMRRLLKPDTRDAAYQELVKQGESMAEILRELGFVQAGVRLESVVLQPMRITSDDAFQIARSNRLDIMNQRAEVVDQWRLIAFNADKLESDLDFTVSGDIGTLDRNIAKFRDQTGSLSVGVRFDSPITRLDERNVYRQSLIDYQRVRRDYIQFEDTVKRSLRSTLSGVKLFEAEIELRREAMRIALRTMDLTQERLQEPPRAGAAGQAGLGQNVVRDLLQAFSDLLGTQNSVMNTYLNYQQIRMLLYRDLGVIQFDEKGKWIDEPLERALERVAAFGEPELPPAVPLPLAAPANLKDPSYRTGNSETNIVQSSGTEPAAPANSFRRVAAELAPSLMPLGDDRPRQVPTEKVLETPRVPAAVSRRDREDGLCF